MSLGYRPGLPVRVTVVPNEFIDEYMAPANGEYVKVFLYLLRHGEQGADLTSIADALNHTEADVKRALAYWKRMGILEEVSEGTEQKEHPAEDKRTDGLDGQVRYDENRAGQAEAAASDTGNQAEYEADKGLGSTESAAAVLTGAGCADGQKQMIRQLPEVGDTYERMQRLSGDEEFSALLYAVQQYLGKTFTQIECEKFAFFYDGLHMSGELLEYLAEYCAGGGHASIRYIETVALGWYQAGIRTREEAREHTARFSGDTAAVLKAFGITGRTAGTAEQDFIRRWFKEYGFDKSLVVEACSRTITATGTASFPYTDKILKGWSEKGVRTLADVEKLDQEHQKKMADGVRRAAGSREAAGNSLSGGRQELPRKRQGSGNRFHNFEERSGDIDDFAWLKNRKTKEGGADGAQ